MTAALHLARRFLGSMSPRPLDPADADRTVQTLLSGGSDPVISKAPEGAWTSAITDKALQ